MASKNKIAVDIKSSFDNKGTTEGKKEIKGLSDSTESATSKMLAFGKSALGFASVTAAIKAVAAEISKMDKAWQVQETAEIKMQAVLQATGNQLGTNLIELKEYAAGLSELTGIADESILAAQGVMATFTKIGSEVFPEAIEKAADMSAMFGQDLQQSVIQLGTALNDPIAGVGRLKRIGISFTEEQKNTIKSFMELNNVAGAQKIILDELEAEFGGVAAAMGDSAAGASQKLSNAWSDLYEQGGRVINEFLKPLREELAEAVTAIADYIRKSMDMKEIAEKMDLGTATMDEQIWLLEQTVSDYENLIKQAEELPEKMKGPESLLPGKLTLMTQQLALAKKGIRENAQAYIDAKVQLNELIAEQEEQKRLLEEQNKITQYENDSWAMISGQIEALSDPLQFQLENLKNQLAAAKEFLTYGKENNFTATETAEIQEAINLMKAKEKELQEQINERSKKGNDDLSMFAKMQADALEEIKKTNDLKEVQAKLEAIMTDAAEDELEVYKLMKAEVDKLLGVEEERKMEIQTHLDYLQMVAEYEEEQNQIKAERLTLMTAELALKEAIARGDDASIKMNREIITKLSTSGQEQSSEESGTNESEGQEYPAWMDSIASTEIVQLLSEGTDVIGLFVGAALNAAMEVEGMSEALNAVSYIFETLFQTIGPAAIAVIKPFLDVLKSIAVELANNLVPVLIPLIPIIQVFAELISTGLVPVLGILTVSMDLLSVIFIIVLPILQGLAIAFEILMAPVRFLADLFTWVGDILETFAYNITHIFSRQRSYASFHSDAFSGLEERIQRIIDIGGGNVDITEVDNGEGTTVYGGNTTVNQPPDIYVYINFHGPVVAEGGLAKVGEFVAESLQEYVGIGGKLEFLEEAP